MGNRNHAVREVAPGSYHIDEFGLDSMYLIVGSKRALVVDTGTGAADFKGLVEQLTDLPYDVVATHGHTDHIGGAGQFGKIYLHPRDFEMVKGVTVEGRRNYCQSILRTYPTDQPAFSLEDVVDYPAPEVAPIQEGDAFDLGDRVLSVQEAPGHTPGSIVLIDSKTHLVYSGDAYNPIFLLVMPGEDRMAVVRMFRDHAQRLLTRRDTEPLGDFLSGHDCPLNPQVLNDLVACSNGILDGSIQPERTKIHIFDGMFCNYGLAHIVYSAEMLGRF